MQLRELYQAEIRECGLKLLLKLDRFCRENHINYSLGEGTLIGAVRHKGFIPWDDDIDVLMDRPDYERFIAEYNNKTENGEKSQVISIHNNPEWHHLFSRLVDTETVVQFKAAYNQKHDKHGVWIDILPIDNAPKSLDPLCRMVHKARFYSNLENCRVYSNHPRLILRIVKTIIGVLLKPFPSNFFIKRGDKVLKRYSSQITKKKGMFACIWHDPYVFSSTAFEEYKETEFEGHQLLIAKGFDEYLRVQYGDYLKLPPVEERVSVKHPYRVFLINNV